MTLYMVLLYLGMIVSARTVLDATLQVVNVIVNLVGEEFIVTRLVLKIG